MPVILCAHYRLVSTLFLKNLLLLLPVALEVHRLHDNFNLRQNRIFRVNDLRWPAAISGNGGALFNRAAMGRARFLLYTGFIFFRRF